MASEQKLTTMGQMKTFAQQQDARDDAQDEMIAEKANSSDLAGYLPLSGGTMTGALKHSADFKFQPTAGIVRFGVSSDINQIAVLAGIGSTWFFRPGYDNKADLGTSVVRWKNLYLSGTLSDGTNSIAVADIVSKADSDHTHTSITTDQIDAMFAT